MRSRTLAPVMARSLRQLPVRYATKRREEALMKYILGLVLGIPIPILAIWFLASHC